MENDLEVQTVENESIENETIEEVEETEEIEELEIGFEGDTPTPNDDDDEFEENESQTEVFRNLRNAYKEQKKELKNLKKQLEGNLKPQQQEAKGDLFVEPVYPQLEDFDYDVDLHKKAVDEYTTKKAEYLIKKTEAEKEVKSYYDSYAQEKQALNKEDFAEKEQRVVEILSIEKQNLLLRMPDSAKFVYALGKSSKLNELANIKNDFEFGMEVGKLVTSLREVKKPSKTIPSPEKRIIGNSGSIGDTKLEQLRKEAEKTGDFSKVFAYKKQINN